MPKRRLRGTVTSNKMDQTAVVQVERIKAHPLYHKVIRRRKKYQAHDAENAAQPGDVVIIEECRPLSRHKRWQIVEWLKRSGAA